MKEYKILEVKKNEAEKVMNDMAKEGWEVVSEEELIESKKDRIDPRLAKLKEFKIED